MFLIKIPITFTLEKFLSNILITCRIFLIRNEITNKMLTKRLISASRHTILFFFVFIVPRYSYYNCRYSTPCEMNKNDQWIKKTKKISNEVRLDIYNFGCRHDASKPSCRSFGLK